MRPRPFWCRLADRMEPEEQHSTSRFGRAARLVFVDHWRWVGWLAAGCVGGIAYGIASTHYLSVHGLNLMIGFGAGLGGLGVLVGGAVAYSYGRRASASITAEAHLGRNRVILAARPVVKAVGIFTVNFHKEQGAVVRVTEVWADQAGELHDGQYWLADGVFGRQQVDPGEDLTTTVVFSLPIPSESVAGWRVSLGIRAPTRKGLPRSSAAWADRVFIPKPETPRSDTTAVRS